MIPIIGPLFYRSINLIPEGLNGCEIVTIGRSARFSGRVRSLGGVGKGRQRSPLGEKGLEKKWLGEKGLEKWLGEKVALPVKV